MAAPTDGTVPLTGTAFIDGLTWGASWVFPGSDHVLTYAFSAWPDFTGGSWTPAWRSAMTSALQAWANVADLRFVEGDSGTPFYASTADLAFALSSDVGDYLGAVGLGFPPSPEFVDQVVNRLNYPRAEGDIWFDHTWPGFASFAPGSQGLEVLIHELGHALGLKHSFDEDGGSRPTFYQLGLSQYDNQDWTIMSYTPGEGGVDNLSHAMTPMVLDILAIQHIYGPNLTYHTGDDRYVLVDSGAKQAIWDAGGTDTLDASRIPTGIDIDLTAGSLMRFGTRGNDVAIAFDVVIENATGSAYSDHLYGNTVDNVLRGNGGDDVLDGRGGADAMTGGTGNDTYVVDNLGDGVDELSAQGIDLVRSPLSYTLPDNVENLELIGSGDTDGTGNELDNRLSGNSGTNQLAGLRGNDTYVVDDAKDSILEEIGEGVDQVLSGLASFVLPDHVENLTLIGSGDSQGIGNLLANVLIGNIGNNTLDGGRGADSMAGGNGDDTYQVDFGLDRVTELAGTGTGVDTIVARVSQTLPPNVETLVFDAGAGNLSGSGTAAANTLTGNNAPNLLDGGGGDDTLQGQGGDDTLVGGAGNDALAGGLGRDVLSGGVGNDRFVFDSPIVSGTNVDQIVDFVRGQDAIELSVAIFTALDASGLGSVGHVAPIGTLAAGPASVPAPGQGFTQQSVVATTGTGGPVINQVLTGSGGSALLDRITTTEVPSVGTGLLSQLLKLPIAIQLLSKVATPEIAVLGTGTSIVNDTLKLPAAAELLDRIAAPATAGATVSLAASEFWSGPGAVAQDADDHIIHDTGTGMLYYDADGAGGEPMIPFAQVAHDVTLAAADFHLIA